MLQENQMVCEMACVMAYVTDSEYAKAYAIPCDSGCDLVMAYETVYGFPYVMVYGSVYDLG
jgi:hypothetical protein